MSMGDMLGQVRDAITVKRVFGDAYVQDGVTVIPVAKVQGGGGGGSGGGKNGDQGQGGGFGMRAQPAGVFVIHADGQVDWQPALDLNRIIWGGQLVAIILLLTIRAIVKARAKQQ